MSGREPSIARRVAQWASRLCLAVLFFASACLYRFNTLDGRFGGFDDDHFVPFAYAKQVEAGEQPLRDFAGLGLQGAWPSLTYEVSAWGQRRLGDNLRSEAIVTVAGVGLAAAITFLAAAELSNAWWAALAVPVSVIVAPTLYNYPKVLALATAALAIARYARRPGRAPLIAAAVVTAIAFLFRHDLAVYVGVGVVLACVVAGQRARAVRDVLFYAALTLILLTPSLAYVQRYDGLVQYALDSLALSRREADRTRLVGWPPMTLTTASGEGVGPLTFFDVEQNGVAFLYSVLRLLPVAVVALVWARRPDHDRGWAQRAALALAGMAAFASPLLVRGNIAVRLGDVGPLFSVLAAFVCYEATRSVPGRSVGTRIGGWVPVLGLVAATALSTKTVGFLGSQMATAGMRISWDATMERGQLVWTRLGALPDAAIDAEAPAHPLEIAQYLNRCTLPTDRVVTMTYEPELLPYARRLFGGGRLNIIPDFGLATHQENALVARWRQQSVPIALVEFEEFWNPDSTLAPIVRAYLLEHYTPAGTLPVRGDKSLRLFVQRGRMPVSQFGEARLPCFR